MKARGVEEWSALRICGQGTSQHGSGRGLVFVSVFHPKVAQETPNQKTVMPKTGHFIDSK